jgi:hypothetical protein
VGRYAFRPRIWSVERVVAEIRALHAAGELESTAVLKQNGNADLVGAAARYIGTWEQAMRLAGVFYQPRRTWTKESVIREIRRLHRAGKSLALTQVESSLAVAATRRFGSWRKARAAALPAHEGPYQQWTRRKLLEAIASLDQLGAALTTTSLRERGHGRLINAAVRLFGSWDRARRRAIPAFEPVQRTWSKAKVVRAIRARDRRGASMSTTVASREDLSLVAAAGRYYGSWPAARAAAGVAYRDPRRTWPPERVLAALRARATRDGAIAPVRVSGALYAVAGARFGSFARACQAAGLRLVHGSRLRRRRGARRPAVTAPRARSGR